MNTRDIVTLVGAGCSAVGAVLVNATHNSTAWWIGTSLAALGPVLVGGARAVIKDPDK